VKMALNMGFFVDKMVTLRNFNKALVKISPKIQNKFGKTLWHYLVRVNQRQYRHPQKK